MIAKHQKLLVLFFSIFFFGCIAGSEDRKDVVLLIPNTKNMETISLINNLERNLMKSGFSFKYLEGVAGLSGQAESIRLLLKNTPDYLIIEPSKTIGISDVIEDCFNLGVKVIFLNSTAKLNDEIQITAKVKADNEKEGRLAAEGFSQFFNGNTGNIIEIQGKLGYSITKDRAIGFRTQLQKYDNLEILDVIQNCENRFSAYSSTLEVIEENRENLNAVFAHNDIIGMGVLDALIEANINIPIISIGGSEDVVKAIISTCYYGVIKSDSGTEFLVEIISGSGEQKKYYILESKYYNKETADRLLHED